MSTSLEGMPERTAAADALVGRKIMDREGIRYGVVRHVHIDQDTFKVQGVTARRGFRRNYYIPERDIAKFTDESVLLETPPIIAGSRVVDIDGHRLGKIKRLHRGTESDQIESIEVTDGIFGTRILSRSEIWGVGERITLKLTKAEFKALE